MKWFWQGIIDLVKGLSDWVRFLVITEKLNGRLGICLDLKDLKKTIKKEIII